MLLMIQKVFYGGQSALVQGRTLVRDVNGREHVAMWSFVSLMVLLGIASPYWMKAIDPAMRGYATAASGPERTAHPLAIHAATILHNLPTRSAEAK